MVAPGKKCIIYIWRKDNIEKVVLDEPLQKKTPGPNIIYQGRNMAHPFLGKIAKAIKKAVAYAEKLWDVH